MKKNLNNVSKRKVIDAGVAVINIYVLQKKSQDGAIFVQQFMKLDGTENVSIKAKNHDDVIVGYMNL